MCQKKCCYSTSPVPYSIPQSLVVPLLMLLGPGGRVRIKCRGINFGSASNHGTLD